MKNLKNKVQLIGRLGVDPQVKHLENGKVLANLSLATSEMYINKKGEKVNETQWHRVVVWGKKAETVERFLTKGDEVAVEGKLLNRSYEDKNGVTRYMTEIVVSEILFLNNKKNNTAEVAA